MMFLVKLALEQFDVRPKRTTCNVLAPGPTTYKIKWTTDVENLSRFTPLAESETGTWAVDY